MKLKKQYGINALGVMGIVIYESSWNDSPRSKDGSNNITGFGVYTPLSRGEQFNSKERCILETAKALKINYLTKDGKYFNGCSLYNINTMYCLDENKKPNYKWSKDINSIIYDLMNKANK